MVFACGVSDRRGQGGLPSFREKGPFSAHVIRDGFLADFRVIETSMCAGNGRSFCEEWLKPELWNASMAA